MRIGVDATSWFNGRGYGRYLRELLPELVALDSPHRFLLFVEAVNAKRLPDLGDRCEIVPVVCREVPSEAAASGGNRGPGDLLRFTKALRSAEVDLFFCPTVYSFFPLPRGQRAVIAFHDAIAERFPKLTLPSFRDRLFWGLKTRLARWQGNLFLTVSDFAAGDLVRHVALPKRKLRVATSAPSAVYQQDVSAEEIDAARESLGLPSDARWLSYVGGFNPHKRIDVLIEAHSRLLAEGYDNLHLLLVGTRSEDVFFDALGSLDALIEERGSGAKVHWTGFVDDERLRALHAGAVAAVLPSECEGYGLPAMEAAACGGLAVATTESPLPALLEGGGLFVPPGNVEALAFALRELLDDEDRRLGLVARGKERARELNWAKTAAQVLAVLEEAAS